MMEFNPLFLNINSQISSTGNLKLNRFGNLSYLFKDIIKVNMNVVSSENDINELNSQNEFDKNINNLSQISVSEEELKKVIETLLSKFGKLSKNTLPSSKTERVLNKQDGVQNNKDKDPAGASININNIISQLEAGKVIKLNISGLDEDYSLEISKTTVETVSEGASNSLANESVNSSLDDIQTTKQLFTFNNQAETQSKGFIFNNDNIISNQADKSSADNILLNENPGPNKSELNNIEQNVKTASEANVETININGSQTEDLFKELKSLLENRADKVETSANKTDQNYKLKIVKQDSSNILNETQNNKALSKSEVLQPKVSEVVYKDNEKLFEVNQKLSAEAQKDFKELENQNNTFSKIKISSSEEISERPIENKITNENKSLVDKDAVKTSSISKDENVNVKTIKIDSNGIKSDNNISDQIKVKENIPEVKAEKTSSKAEDSKEVKNSSDGKNIKQSDIKVRTDSGNQSSNNSTELGETKNDIGLKNNQQSNSKDQSNFNDQNSNHAQNQKESKTSVAAINSSNQNDSTKEVKTELLDDKSNNQKMPGSQFSSDLKNVQDSGVKETRGAQVFHDQPKMIKPSQIINEISSFIQKGDVKSIVLKLTPENLGKVKVEVNMIDKVLHANIEVENENVRQTIQTNFDQLKSSLIQSGITVAGLTISLNNGSEKNTKTFEAKKKTTNYNQEIKSEDKLTIAIPKKMGYNTYEYLA